MTTPRHTSLLAKCKHASRLTVHCNVDTPSHRFIQSPLSDMKKQYVDSIEAADADIKNLEKTQKYWERSASDAQGNLKDILQGPRT